MRFFCCVNDGCAKVYRNLNCVSKFLCATALIFPNGNSVFRIFFSVSACLPIIATILLLQQLLLIKPRSQMPVTLALLGRQKYQKR